MTAPAVTDDTVYVRRGEVVAFHATTGRRRWSRADEVAEGALAMTEDRVTTTSGIVESLLRGDGQRQWQFDPLDPIFGSPVVADGTVYVAGSGGRIYELDAGIGAELWWVDTGGDLESNVTVVEGGLFVGTTHPRGPSTCLAPSEVSTAPPSWVPCRPSYGRARTQLGRHRTAETSRRRGPP
jgi:outer membrane protein assembly factor BamB